MNFLNWQGLAEGPLVVGVDTSTQSTKALVVDASTGQVVAVPPARAQEGVPERGPAQSNVKDVGTGDVTSDPNPTPRAVHDLPTS